MRLEKGSRIKSRINSPIKSNQKGFTLIEVLVAVFVMAVGILGVAGMQAIGVRESANLYFRTQADLMINDIVDRMHANRTAARGQADGLADHVYDGLDTVDGTYTKPTCSPCSEEEMADADMAGWQVALNNSGLPSARGRVALIGDSTNLGGSVVGSVYRISVFWDEDRDGDVGEGCDPNDPDDMACTTVVVEI